MKVLRVQSITNHSPTRRLSRLPLLIIPCRQIQRENVEHNDRQSPVIIGAGRIESFPFCWERGRPQLVCRRASELALPLSKGAVARDLVPLFRTNQCHHQSEQTSDQVVPLIFHKHTWSLTLDNQRITQAMKHSSVQVHLAIFFCFSIFCTAQAKMSVWMVQGGASSVFNTAINLPLSS